MTLRMAFIATIAMVVCTPVYAASKIAVSPELRQSAMLCIGEALRLCPAALTAKDHGMACILGKRHLLSVPCRSVYDQGLRLLAGGDVHLLLRPPRPR